jgi:nicotinamide riboside kinase
VNQLGTTVINLFGGSGIGKSTLAAQLFAEMKCRQKHVELVREYVKLWAHIQRKVDTFDQLYLLGKQSHYEAQLYKKVDFLVTDSPLLLCGIYETFYDKTSFVADAALAFVRKAESNGVQYINFVLERNKPFDSRGRFEDEATARQLDKHVIYKLNEWGINYTIIPQDVQNRVEFILNRIPN